MDTTGVTVLDVCGVRGLLCCAVCWFFMWKNGVVPSRDVPRAAWKLLGTRGALGTINFLGMRGSSLLIPLAAHSILKQTSVFWTTILALLFLSDPVKGYEYVAMLVAFIGVLGVVAFKEGSN